MFSTTGLARLVRVGLRLVTGSRTVGWYSGGGTAMQAGRCSGSDRTLHGAIERRTRMDQQLISGNCGNKKVAKYHIVICISVVYSKTYTPSYRLQTLRAQALPRAKCTHEEKDIARQSTQ
jgi:hypothetical protein